MLLRRRRRWRRQQQQQQPQRLGCLCCACCCCCGDARQQHKQRVFSSLALCACVCSTSRGRARRRRASKREDPTRQRRPCLSCCASSRSHCLAGYERRARAPARSRGARDTHTHTARSNVVQLVNNAAALLSPPTGEDRKRERARAPVRAKARERLLQAAAGRRRMRELQWERRRLQCCPHERAAGARWGVGDAADWQASRRAGRRAAQRGRCAVLVHARGGGAALLPPRASAVRFSCLARGAEDALRAHSSGAPSALRLFNRSLARLPSGPNGTAHAFLHPQLVHEALEAVAWLQRHPCAAQYGVAVGDAPQPPAPPPVESRRKVRRPLVDKHLAPSSQFKSFTCASLISELWPHHRASKIELAG